MIYRPLISFAPTVAISLVPYLKGSPDILGRVEIGEASILVDIIHVLYIFVA
jgi:hypothetical protein